MEDQDGVSQLCFGSIPAIASIWGVKQQKEDPQHCTQCIKPPPVASWHQCLVSGCQFWLPCFWSSFLIMQFRKSMNLNPCWPTWETKMEILASWLLVSYCGDLESEPANERAPLLSLHSSPPFLLAFSLLVTLSLHHSNTFFKLFFTLIHSYNHTFICWCIQNNLYKELKYASHLAQNFLIPTLLATCFTMFVLCYKESGATF